MAISKLAPSQSPHFRKLLKCASTVPVPVLEYGSESVTVDPYVILYCACCPGRGDGSLITHSEGWRNLIPSLVAIGQRWMLTAWFVTATGKRRSDLSWRQKRQAPCHFALRSPWHRSSHAMKAAIQPALEDDYFLPEIRIYEGNSRSDIKFQLFLVERAEIKVICT